MTVLIQYTGCNCWCFSNIALIYDSVSVIQYTGCNCWCFSNIALIYDSVSISLYNIQAVIAGVFQI